MAKQFYRLNQHIQAQEVRVVDDKGKQIGVMPLNKALKQAQEKGLDLVEVAPRAKPPVCKIVDFKKFRFLESKKTQESNRKSGEVEIKEVRLTPFMAEADFGVRIRRAEDFLKKGHRVKLSVFFKGRAITKKEFGYKLLEKAREKLELISQVDGGPRFLGRRLELALNPIKGGKNGKKDKNKDEKISR